MFPRRRDRAIFLPGLKPPIMSGETEAGGVKRAASAGDVSPDSMASRIQEADDALRVGDFLTAKRILTYLRDSVKTVDPYIIQRLAFSRIRPGTTRRRKRSPREACDLLYKLNAETSNDTETLGRWGAVHKRLWDKTKDAAALDKAIRSCERGFSLRNDYYNGINCAFLRTSGVGDFEVQIGG
jgi:hypothetical protein